MDDRYIISLFTSRSEKALSATMEEYGNYMSAIAYNITRSKEDANECINDSLLSLWNTIPPQQPNSLKAYLGAIVRNISLDKYRKLNALKRKNVEFDLILDELSECLPSSETIETQFEAKETSKVISAFLLKQSKQHRLIFICRYYRADSISTIANEYKMSVSSVKTTLFRLRNQLKVHLEKEGIQL